MEIRLSASKRLDLQPIRTRLVQGERFAERPVIILPKYYSSIDLATLTFIMRASSEEFSTMAEELVAFETSGDYMRAEWEIPESFCAVPGLIKLELRGVQGGDNTPIVKFQGDQPIYVNPTNWESVATPNIANWERILSEVQTARAATEIASTSAGESQASAAASASVAEAAATRAEAHATPVSDAQVDETGHLILTLGSGDTVDAGMVRGPQGEPGEGVPAGGTAGQVLAKASSEDYDTEWVDQTGGSGGGVPGSAPTMPVTQTQYEALPESEKNSEKLFLVEDYSGPDPSLPTLADIIPDGAGPHNAIYRGQFLGGQVTGAQYAAIADGTFKDLFIGDYWTIGEVNYRIAAFDYYLRTGDKTTEHPEHECTTHHIVLVPDTGLYNARMNATATTAGGYTGSEMYTANLNSAKGTIHGAFTGHILTHRVFLVNAVTGGRSSGSVWVDSDIDLMNEQMVYGGAVFSPTSDGTTAPSNCRVEKSQLPLFAHRPDLISNRQAFWLRDVVTTAYFAYVAPYGGANCGDAPSPVGVRPAFCICG